MLQRLSMETAAMDSSYAKELKKLSVEMLCSDGEKDSHY